MKKGTAVKILLASVPIIAVAAIPVGIKVYNAPPAHTYKIGDCVSSVNTPTTYQISKVDIEKKSYMIDVVKYRGIKVKGFKNPYPEATFLLIDSEDHFKKSSCP